MARNKSKTLTEGELRIMEVVWDLVASTEEPVTVKAVVEGLRPSGPLAYNTVQTVLNILTDKGVLAREKSGRAFSYLPQLSRGAARAQALKHLTQQFFGGSRKELLHNLLQEPADPAEMEELRALLADSDQRSGNPEGEDS